MTRKIVAFAGRAGCVDSETEYLSENGWKRISEYSGEKIAVYSSDGVIHWEVPENFICEPATDWYTLKTKYGLDMKLSGEHNVYYITSKGNLYHKTMREIYENNILKSKNKNRMVSAKIPTTFKTSATRELPYTDDELRLIVAVQADGTLMFKDKFRLNLKKKRKQERLEYLLKQCGIKYTYTVAKECNTNAGYISYYFYLPYGVKVFPSDWYTISERQLKVIADEAPFWDGWVDPRTNSPQYFSNVKSNADFIQFAYIVANGFRTSIHVDNRVGVAHYKTINYAVKCTSVKYVSFHKSYKDTSPLCTIEQPKLGEYKYCFTTSTGMWVMRRNNNVYITGNSGKDYRCQQLEKQGNYKKMAFADALRKVAFTSLGIDFEKGMKQYEWLKAKPSISVEYEDGDGMSINFRYFLEKLGTEGIRKYDKDFWAKALIKDIEEVPEELNICISDLRFHNEYKYLKEYAEEHGYIFEFIFCDYHSERYQENNTHASARLAEFLKDVGYEDGDLIKAEDMQHYIEALEEVNAI